MIFKHEYTDATTYIIRGSDGRIYSSDDELYQEFIKTNTPEKTSGDRFVSIVNGQVVIDPNKAATMTAEIINQKMVNAYQRTKSYVQSEDPFHMPPSRDANWRDFVRIVDKKRAGQTLTALESGFLSAMIANGETEDGVYNTCTAGLLWAMQCWGVYEAKKAEILAASDPATVDETAMIFPEWIGY